MPDVRSRRLSSPDLTKEDELSSYIRRNLLRAVLVLIALFGGLSVVGSIFQEQLLAVTHGIYATIGVAGLLATLFITDAIFSPLPPDLVLIVIANSALRDQWPWLLPVIGLLSALAGNVGWWFGHRFSKFEWSTRFVGKLRDKYAKQVLRYDRWAVTLGAITPLPFSLICISSGALGMRWRRLAPITLLRLPRFAVVYAVIAYSAAM